MIDKNLFLYDLAVTAIFKDEGHYLKEWLDYHLLAGVEHFYLYNNNSSDNYKEVLAPYVEANLVTLTDFPGKMMQYPAYEDAIDKYRFDCRYMAFIDIDEFIFPKTNQNIVEILDDILSSNPNAAGLGINWQIFGSNGQEAADYSRGVLERFTRRAPSDWQDSNGFPNNFFKKDINNPRLVRYCINPHYSYYFSEKFVVNSNGERMKPSNKPILSDKIVVNHYIIKSKEEFLLKRKKGRAETKSKVLPPEIFQIHDRNEIFDEDILKYRAARAENFSFESNATRFNRVINALVKNLLQTSLEDPLVDKMEPFLTCRAVAEKFQIKIGDDLAEEIAIAWIYRTLLKANPLTIAEVQQFLKALPEILTRPFPICRELKTLTQDNVLPRLCEALKNEYVCDTGVKEEDWKVRADMIYIQQLLRLIKL